MVALRLGQRSRGEQALRRAAELVDHDPHAPQDLRAHIAWAFDELGLEAPRAPAGSSASSAR